MSYSDRQESEIEFLQAAFSLGEFEDLRFKDPVKVWFHKFKKARPSLSLSLVHVTGVHASAIQNRFVVVLNTGS